MKTIRIANSKIELINTWINTFSKTYGLSFTSSKYICKTLGYKKKTILKFNSKLIIKQFSELELLIKNFEYKFENNLKNRKNWNLKKLRDLACYRGHRNTFGLPNRGQRTCSNGKTKALFFRTVTSKRKKMKYFRFNKATIRSRSI